MAVPTPFKFGDGVVYIAAPGTTPTYVKLCGFTEDQLQFAKETGSTNLPDCDNPDLAPWTATDVIALSWTFTASGLLVRESLVLLEDAALSSLAYLFRFYIKGGGTGVGTPDRLWQGQGHVTFNQSGTRGEKRAIEFTVVGDGVLAKSSTTIPA